MYWFVLALEVGNFELISDVVKFDWHGYEFSADKAIEALKEKRTKAGLSAGNLMILNWKHLSELEYETFNNNVCITDLPIDFLDE